MEYTKFITIEPGKRSGQPCIRGTRITVQDVLEYLAGGMTVPELLADFPELTVDTTADLVVEVADSSLNFDTNEKRLLYARASIREYWVVDINGRRLLAYRDPQAGDYVTQQALGPADTISPLSAPAAAVRVADLLV